MSAWLDVNTWGNSPPQKKWEVNCGPQMKVKCSPTETRAN